MFWPLLCLCLPFVIFELCLDSGQREDVIKLYISERGKKLRKIKTVWNERQDINDSG